MVNGESSMAKFDLVGNDLLHCISRSAERTKRGGNIDSSQIAAHTIFPKLPKRNGMNHLIFHLKFPC